MTNEEIVRLAAEMIGQSNDYCAPKVGPVSYHHNQMRDGSVQRYTQIEMTKRGNVWELPND